MAQITAAMVKELREQTGAGMMDVKAALVEADGDMEQARTILRKKGLATASKKAGRITAEGAVTALVEGNAGVLVEVNCETDFVARTEGFRNFANDVAKIILHSKSNSVEELNGQTWPDSSETVAQKTQELIGSIKENITIRRFTRYEAAASGAIATYIHAGGKIGVMTELVGSDDREGKDVAKEVAMHIAASDPRFLRREDVTEKDLENEREIARDQARQSGKPENIIEKMVAGKMDKFYGEACLLEQPYIKGDKQSVAQYLQAAGKDKGCKYVVTRFVRYKLGEGIEKKGDDFAGEVAAALG
jgi:elongation factor Ts